VDWVAECRVVVSFHLGIAAQYVVVLGILALVEGTPGGSIGSCIGAAGAACIEVPTRWLVLICEEGLVPPINTNSSDKYFAKMRQQKRGRVTKESLAAYLAISRQVDLQRLGIVLEAKRSHSKEYVFAVDRFALLLLALFGCWTRYVSGCGMRINGKLTFAGDEGDELADALLHAFFGFLGYLCVVGKRHLHDAGDWSKITNVSI
jgi:predicted small integral membrane protein